MKVNAVKVKELPAIDDEFAKDVSEFDTLADLKKDIKAKMTAEREEAATRAFEDVLMEKVAEEMTGEIPDAMVEEQARAFVENFARQLQSQGMNMAQYLQMTGTDEAGMLEQAKEPALRQVRMDLAIAAIVKAEGIEVTDEDVDAEYTKLAGQYNMEADTIKKYIEASMVKEQIMRSKAIAVVVDNAKAIKTEAKKSKKADEAEETDAE